MYEISFKIIGRLECGGKQAFENSFLSFVIEKVGWFAMRFPL